MRPGLRATGRRWAGPARQAWWASAEDYRTCRRRGSDRRAALVRRAAGGGWRLAAGGWRRVDGQAAWRLAAGASTSLGPNQRARKRPKELVGTSVRRVQWLRTSPQSLVVAESLARWPCDLRTWFPGPSRGSLLEPVWRFNLPLRARRNVRRRVGPRQCVCPRISAGTRQTYPRTCRRCGQAVDTLMAEV